MWPSADTQSRTTVCPSIQPSSPSLRTTMLSGCRGHGTTEGSTPTRFSGCFGCSAKEASGQAIAEPPISVMSFHRLILTPHGRGRGPPGYHFSDLIASHCCIAMGGLRRGQLRGQPLTKTAAAADPEPLPVYPQKQTNTVGLLAL